MEEIIKIFTNDNHLIDGTLNYMDKSNEKLIIFVHGLSDNKHHRLNYNAAKFFKTRGFHTFRFSLYSGEKMGRILEECSIKTFIEDTNNVIEYFRGKYKEVYLICHSLGFVVLDCDLKKIKKIVLWDPSLSLKKDRIESLKFDPELNLYFINWGVSFIISKQLKIDWENINDKRLLRNLKVPVGIFMAEENDLKIGWKDNLKYLSVKYSYAEIKGASHGFSEEGIDDYLYKETLKYLLR